MATKQVDIQTPAGIFNVTLSERSIVKAETRELQGVKITCILIDAQVLPFCLLSTLREHQNALKILIPDIRRAIALLRYA